MICPSCLKTIEDNSTFCPHCHAYVGGSASGAGEFVFCDGCGARLSVRDRTCPKCGRPAPGILSTQSASSDLAAGRTASFPRLSSDTADNAAPKAQSSVAQVLNDSIDPAVTSVLRASDIERHTRQSAPGPSYVDPYHTERRSYKGVIIALVLLLLIGGGAAFVVKDPLNMMPGLAESFQEAAQEMFPSRQVAEQVDDSSSDAQSDTSDAGSDANDTTNNEPLTDDEVYTELSTIYQQIVDYGSSEQFGECVDAFNSFCIASSHDDREGAAASAYALRDSVQQTIDEVTNLGLRAPADTAYSQDIEHMSQLAGWMYGRIDAICKSWDVSLSYQDGEYPNQHQDEILAPMREAGSNDYDSYKAYIDVWEPEQK